MREARLRPLLLLIVPAIVGTAVVVMWWPGRTLWYVAAAYIVSDLVLIPGPSGRRASALSAVAAATALVSGSVTMTLAPAAMTLPVGTVLLQWRHGRRVVDDVMPSEYLGLVLFAAGYFPVTHLFGIAGPAHPGVLAAFTGAGLLWFGGTVAIRTLWNRESTRFTRRLILLTALLDWPVYLAMMSSAALFAVTVGSMGFWSVPLAGLPFLFSHLSLTRVQNTRRTYDQTIKALGAIPEASGQVAIGHSARCGDLAVAVGAELGSGVGEVRRIEYAALLHDIGRVVLGNPAMAQREYSFADVSGWSAAIISEARYLEPVADIVAAQHQPYRKPGEVRDPAVPVGSQVVRVVARYDSALEEGVTPLQACELLHEGAAYEYDPGVVMALRRVLERRKII